MVVVWTRTRPSFLLSASEKKRYLFYARATAQFQEPVFIALDVNLVGLRYNEASFDVLSETPSHDIESNP